MKAADIARALALFNGTFPYRQYLCVENVSWGLLPWEADFVAMSKAGYLTEVEIKISHADLKADFEKHKHRRYGEQYSGWDLIKSFYYAMPAALAELAKSKGTFERMPHYAGVIAVHAPTEHRAHGWCETLRPAACLNTARALTAGEQYQLARLGVMRYWTRTTGEPATAEAA